MFTDDEKTVLAKLSERGKVGLPCDPSLIPPDMKAGLVSLGKRGAMELIDRAAVTPNVTLLVDVYGLTQAGMDELVATALAPR